MTKYLFLIFFLFQTIVFGITQVEGSDYKIHVVLNQPAYSPGDTVYFKTYILGKDKRLVKERVIINLVVADKEGNKISYQKFRADFGRGSNQWAVPESLVEGNYSLTFYPDYIGVDEGPPYWYRMDVPIVIDRNLTTLAETDKSLKSEILKDRGEIKVNINGLDGTVATRSKSNLEINITNDKNLPVASYFNVLVENSDLFKNIPPIQSYEYESGESYQFAENATYVGEVYFEGEQPKARDSIHITFYLQKTKWIHQVVLKPDRKVKFWVPDIYYDDEILFVAKNKKGLDVPGIRINWEKHHEIKTVTPSDWKADGADLAFSEFSLKKKLINQSYNFFEADEADLLEVNSNTKAEGKHVYFPKNYRPFATMEEFIKEVVIAVKVRNRGDRKVIRARTYDPSKNDPVYLIDGKLTKNTDFFLSIDPQEIKYLEVVIDPRKLLRYALLGVDGLLVVQSLDQDIEIPPFEGSQKVTGMTRSLKFNNPDGNASLKKPDFRSTIFWEPALRTKDDGKASIDLVWTDDTGKMTLKIDGITEDGKYFTTKKEIEVNFSSVEN